jgi:hypothetical protein
MLHKFPRARLRTLITGTLACAAVLAVGIGSAGVHAASLASASSEPISPGITGASATPGVESVALSWNVTDEPNIAHVVVKLGSREAVLAPSARSYTFTGVTAGSYSFSVTAELGGFTPPASGIVGLEAKTQSTYEGFSASNPPEGRPGSPTSPFNVEVGSSPSVRSNSGEMVSYVLKLGSPSPGNATSGPKWKHPTVYASNTDPVVELHATESWGSNALTGRKIHVPAAAQAAPPKPSEGGDAHLEIVLAPVDAHTPGEAVDLWRANPPSGGVLKFAWGSAANIAGSGIGGKATAAGLDLWAGQVRGIELLKGKIDHALCLVVKSNKSGSYVYPASHTDGSSSAAAAPQEGQRFYLAYSDSEIAALPVKPWKKTVLSALAHYGGYDCDSGGPGLAVEFESSVMFTAFGQPNPLAQVGEREQLPTYNGEYVFNLAEGVNWSRLRAIAPPAH